MDLIYIYIYIVFDQSRGSHQIMLLCVRVVFG